MIPFRRSPLLAGACALALLLLIVPLLPGRAQAQPRSASDDLVELQHRYEQAAGAERLDAALRLAELTALRSPTQALEYGRVAESLIDPAVVDPTTRYRLALAMARAAGALPDGEAASSWTVQALQAARESGDPQAIWRATLQSAIAARDLGDTDQALALLKDAEEMASRLPDPQAGFTTRTILGGTLLAASQYTAALEVLLDALLQAEDVQTRQALSARSLVLLHNQLGAVYFYLEAYEPSIAHYRLALESPNSPPRTQVILRRNIGASLSKLEDAEQALQYNLETLELAQSTGDRNESALLQFNIAQNLIDLERPAEAVPYARQALESFESFTDRRHVAMARYGVGRALDALGHLDEAEQLLEQSLAAIGPDGDPYWQRRMTEALAIHYERRGDFARALQFQRESQQLQADQVSLHRQQATELQKRFETVKRDQRIDRLDRQVRYEHTLRVWITVAAMAGLVLAVGAWWSWRSQRRVLRRLRVTHHELVEQTELNARQQRELKVLEGLLPICADCKKIRDEDQDWTELEAYIRTHSEARFTHSFCPDCATRQLREMDVGPGDDANAMAARSRTRTPPAAGDSAPS